MSLRGVVEARVATKDLVALDGERASEQGGEDAELRLDATIYCFLFKFYAQLFKGFRSFLVFFS